MKRFSILIASISIFTVKLLSQTSYKDSIEQHRKEYVKDHEVVKKNDKKFMSFFAVDVSMRIEARFVRKVNSPWFLMEASGPHRVNYRVYGTLHFTVHDTVVSLNIYQSQTLMQTEKYRDHLFIPFADLTCGEESYSGGKYIDLNIADLKDETYVIDFNRAYNPYCAYVSDVYSCPLPPRENRLNVTIRAGEKDFKKPH